MIMDSNTLEKLDAYFFRIFGLILGVVGAVAMLVNNPVRQVFTNAYGIIFFASFVILGVYSIASIVVDIFLTKPDDTQPGS